MSRIFAYVVIVATLALPCSAEAQPTSGSSTAAPRRAAIAPPAPAFKVGGIVIDRTGAQLGSIESVADAERGPMVVIKIDGKLISVPQSTLTLNGENVVSSQTKAEIMSAARAPG